MAKVNNDTAITASGNYAVTGYESGKLYSCLIEGTFDGATVKLQWRKQLSAYNDFDEAGLTRTTPGGANFAITASELNINVASVGASTSIRVSLSPLMRT